MKKYTTLSIVTAVVLLSGTSVLAEVVEEATYTRVGLSSNADTYQGVSIGHYASYWDSTYSGIYNTTVGGYAGYLNKAGYSNVYIGWSAGYSASVYGNSNVAIGVESRYNYAGSHNNSIGYRSGYNAVGTDYSVMLGNAAGYDANNADYSVFIGYQAGYHMDRAHTLMIENSDSDSPLIYGEFDNDLVRINGNFETVWSGSDTANNHNLLGLSVNNSGDGASDVGFSMENIESDFKWTFRTYNPSEGFAASKIGTGGTEFEVGNTGTDLSTTVVKMGGVVVFKDGHLVNTSGNELTSLLQEQNIKMAEMEAEAKAKDAEIAEMKVKDAAMEAKIAKLETMQKKVAMMESILTNLALDTSSTKKEKVSVNLK